MEEVKKVATEVFVTAKRILSLLVSKITCRFTLTVVNLLFMTSGITILAIGIIVPNSYEKYRWFLSPEYFTVPMFCIAIGGITLIVGALVGFLAVLINNYIIRMAYVGAMIVVFILQLFATAAGYLLQFYSVSLIWDGMRSSMADYKYNSWVAMHWDVLQQDFRCCGILGRNDWLVQLNTTESEGLPVSCCPFDYGSVHVFECTFSSAYYQQCRDGFGNFVREQVGVIGIIGAVLAGIQALLIICAICAANISREKKIDHQLLVTEDKP